MIKNVFNVIYVCTAESLQQCRYLASYVSHTVKPEMINLANHGQIDKVSVHMYSTLIISVFVYFIKIV